MPVYPVILFLMICPVLSIRQKVLAVESKNRTASWFGISKIGEPCYIAGAFVAKEQWLIV